jgi:proteic killer suppression protein
MISSFTSRALKRFWVRNDPGAVSPDWAPKIKRLLSALDRATKPEDLSFPGSGFHALTGDIAGRYALTVSRNWRITFAWADGNAPDVDLEDYHGG